MGYTSLFDFDDWYSILDDHFIVICGGPASERAVLFMKRQNVLFLSVEQFSVCNYSILLLNQCLIWVLVLIYPPIFDFILLISSTLTLAVSFGVLLVEFFQEIMSEISLSRSLSNV